MGCDHRRWAQVKYIVSKRLIMAIVSHSKIFNTLSHVGTICFQETVDMCLCDRHT